MEFWQALQFAAALWVAISALVLIINKCNVIEKAEKEAWIRQFKQMIHNSAEKRNISG